MCHYFCDVRSGAYRDEPGSDEEIEELELPDDNNPPADGKQGKKRVSIWAKDTGDENDGEDKDQQEDANLNSVPRTENATDITKV